MVVDLSKLNTKPQEDPERIRLLVCNICQTVEELPMQEDRGSEYDPWLAGLLERHGHETLDLSGDRPDAKVFDVERKHWDDHTTRKEIVERIRKEEKHSGLGDDFYDATNTYREEALKCYQKHNMPTPQTGCIDFRDKSKRISNTLVTQDEKSELTKDQQASLRDIHRNTKTYICYWCPYFTALQSQKS